MVPEEDPVCPNKCFRGMVWGFIFVAPFWIMLTLVVIVLAALAWPPRQPPPDLAPPNTGIHLDQPAPPEE